MELSVQKKSKKILRHRISIPITSSAIYILNRLFGCVFCEVRVNVRFLHRFVYLFSI